MPSSEESDHINIYPQGKLLGVAGTGWVGVRGVWLRTIGEDIQVLVEGADGWRLVIEEHREGIISHIVEPDGILNAPLDQISEGSRS